MAKYDILLFENCEPWKTHKVDMLLLGRMLQAHGMRVGILDIYGEEQGDSMGGFPVEHLKDMPPFPGFVWGGGPFSKLTSSPRLVVFHQQIDRYYRKAIPQFYDLADMFYVGSYQDRLSRELLKLDKPTVLWGLRSYRMRDIAMSMVKKIIPGWYKYSIKRRFLGNPMMKLMVSTQEIMDEHKALGVPAGRMFVRPERCIDTIPADNFNSLSPVFTFLTIGQLRPEKRVDMSVRSFLACNIPASRFVIAGTSQWGVGRLIQEASQGDARIERIDRFLDKEEYERQMNEMHYLVLADAQDQSAVTNGTLIESLCHLRPFIAPNYPPYSTLANEYGVGLLYNPDEPQSQREAMQKAAATDCRSFAPAIRSFLQTILFDKVSGQVYNNLMTLVEGSMNAHR